MLPSLVQFAITIWHAVPRAIITLPIIEMPRKVIHHLISFLAWKCLKIKHKEHLTEIQSLKFSAWFTKKSPVVIQFFSHCQFHVRKVRVIKSGTKFVIALNTSRVSCSALLAYFFSCLVKKIHRSGTDKNKTENQWNIHSLSPLVITSVTATAQEKKIQLRCFEGVRCCEILAN